MYKRLEQTIIDRLDKEYSKEVMYSFLLPSLMSKRGALEKMNYPLVAAEVWHDAKELVSDVIHMDYDGLHKLRMSLISRYRIIDGLPFTHSSSLAEIILMCVAYMLWFEYQVADEESRHKLLSFPNPHYGEMECYSDEEKGDIVEIDEQERLPYYYMVCSVCGKISDRIFGLNFQKSWYDKINCLERDGITYCYESLYLPKEVKKVEENRDDKIRKEIRDYVMRLKPALKENMVEKFSEVWDDILSDTEIYQKLKVTKDRNFKLFSKHAICRIIGRMYDGKKYFVGEYDTPKLDKLLEPSVSEKESKYRHIMTSGSESAEKIAELAEKYYNT